METDTILCCRQKQKNSSKAALRKLDYLNGAMVLDDLKVPPANRLERLKGDLQSFYSIRINKQYRIIFKFDNGDAYDVKIIDYH